jgi:hypothetical protein
MSIKEQPNSPVFSFTLTAFYDEHSKDSHKISKTYSLSAGVLRYVYVTSGVLAGNNKSAELSANASKVAEIKDKLKALGLYTNYVKDFTVTDRVFIVRTGKKLNIQDGTEEYSISVTGGLPAYIKDEFHDKLSAFEGLISYLFYKADHP